jgi:hypothetical protein
MTRRSTPSLAQCAKALLSFILLAPAQAIFWGNRNSTAIKTKTFNDSAVNYTCSAFSYAGTNYQVCVADNFPGCEDSAQLLYNQTLDTASQIQQGKCQGENVSLPYPISWKLQWQDVNISIQVNSSFFAVNFYSAENATVSTLFLNCSELAFQNNTENYKEAQNPCENDSATDDFNYDYLFFVSFIAFIYLCKDCCKERNTQSLYVHNRYRAINSSPNNSSAEPLVSRQVEVTYTPA